MSVYNQSPIRHTFSPIALNMVLHTNEKGKSCFFNEKQLRHIQTTCITLSVYKLDLLHVHRSCIVMSRMSDILQGNNDILQ